MQVSRSPPALVRFTRLECSEHMHCLPPAALHELTSATIMARLMYADERSRIERFQKKMQRMGYLLHRAKRVTETIEVIERRLYTGSDMERLSRFTRLIPRNRAK